MKTIAVIGCGGIANAAHLPALQNMNDVRIKYGCDIIKERAVSSKEKFPKIETVITDYSPFVYFSLPELFFPLWRSLTLFSSHNHHMP